jgi:hypothetical protein
LSPFRPAKATRQAPLPPTLLQPKPLQLKAQPQLKVKPLLPKAKLLLLKAKPPQKQTLLLQQLKHPNSKFGIVNLHCPSRFGAVGFFFVRIEKSAARRAKKNRHLAILL